MVKRRNCGKLDTQAQQHVHVAALSQGIEAFGQRMQPTVDKWTFAQRRQLVAWLIDRVIVNETQVEIRSVVPTGPTGEPTPFCHLRLDYLEAKPLGIQATRLLRCIPIADAISGRFLPLGPPTQEENRPRRVTRP
jgi:site-specific DNA recombinase